MNGISTCFAVRDDATFTTLGAAFSAMSAMEMPFCPVPAYANAGPGKNDLGDGTIAAGAAAEPAVGVAVADILPPQAAGQKATNEPTAARKVTLEPMEFKFIVRV